MSITHPNEKKSNAIRSRYVKYVGRGQSTWTPTQAVIAKAKQDWLETADGRRLLDFSSGVLVSNIGYAHPGFEKHWKAYCKGLPRNAYNLVTEIHAEAAKRLVKSMKAPFAEKTLWAASGSEGIQKAMWCALKRHPERHIILATGRGFHGKKGLANDVTGESSTNPNVRWMPFPCEEEHPESYYAEALEALGKEHEGKIAMFITEPYLGAAGSFHPPKWYHKLIETWCRKNDVPLIFDEVQSCFGRTGNMYAFQSYGIEPDLVVLGKGMASGEACSAVVGRADLIDALDYGEASDTFSAQPSACAAVCATLDVFREEKVVQQARKHGKHLHKLLKELQERFPFITAVRGEGMVYGIEMENPAVANLCVLEAYRATSKRGVHLLGPLAQKVLRASPPLTMQRERLDEAVGLLVKAWERI